MRISDWSSDVCSSDLIPFQTERECDALAHFASQRIKSAHSEFIALPKRRPTTFRPSLPCDWTTRCQSTRSEEHTSELQSLMRISYAVFCLKKKKKTQN